MAGEVKPVDEKDAIGAPCHYVDHEATVSGNKEVISKAQEEEMVGKTGTGGGRAEGRQGEEAHVRKARSDLGGEKVNQQEEEAAAVGELHFGRFSIQDGVCSSGEKAAGRREVKNADNLKRDAGLEGEDRKGFEYIEANLGRRGADMWRIRKAVTCPGGGIEEFRGTSTSHGKCKKCRTHVSGLWWPWYKCSCCTETSTSYCMVCVERRGRVRLEERAEVLDMGAPARGLGRGSPRLSDVEAGRCCGDGWSHVR